MTQLFFFFFWGGGGGELKFSNQFDSYFLLPQVMVMNTAQRKINIIINWFESFYMYINHNIQ